MTNIVSTTGAFTMLQTGVDRVRGQLYKAQAELGSGTPSDYGLTLGANTAVLVGLQQQQGQLQTIQQTNGIAQSRIDATSSILSSLMTDAQSFLQSAVQNDPAAVSPATLQQQARDGLASLRQAMNTFVGGQAIFGGINTDVTVMPQDPTATGSAADTAFQSAFTSAFSMSSTDPNVVSLDSTQVKSFLNSGVESLFSASSWGSAWSKASDTPMASRIGLSRNIGSSISANETAIVDLAKAYSTIASMPLDKMNSAAASAVISSAATSASAAVDGLTALQARVGTMQSDLQSADQAMSVQIDTLTTGIENLAPIDPYATSSKITELQTQLQTAYTLTAQLQKLSLAQYL